jgi:hypothetical protein
MKLSVVEKEIAKRKKKKLFYKIYVKDFFSFHYKNYVMKCMAKQFVPAKFSAARSIIHPSRTLKKISQIMQRAGKLISVAENICWHPIPCCRPFISLL